MSKLHNSFLEHIVKILYDEECLHLAYPALEFVKLEEGSTNDKLNVMEWNKPGVFHELQTLAQAMMIPPFAYSEWTTPKFVLHA